MKFPRRLAAVLAVVAVGAGCMITFSGTDISSALPVVEECSVLHSAPMHFEPDPSSPIVRTLTPGDNLETTGGRLFGPDGVLYAQVNAGGVGWIQARLISCKTINCDLTADRNLNPTECAGWIDTMPTTANCAIPFERQHNPQECAWWPTTTTSTPTSTTSPTSSSPPPITSSTPPEPTSTTPPPVIT